LALLVAGGPSACSQTNPAGGEGSGEAGAGGGEVGSSDPGTSGGETGDGSGVGTGNGSGASGSGSGSNGEGGSTPIGSGGISAGPIGGAPGSSGEGGDSSGGGSSGMGSEGGTGTTGGMGATPPDNSCSTQADCVLCTLPISDQTPCCDGCPSVLSQKQCAVEMAKKDECAADRIAICPAVLCVFPGQPLCMNGQCVAGAGLEQ
jgi:hypothetical protein